MTWVLMGVAQVVISYIGLIENFGLPGGFYF